MYSNHENKTGVLPYVFGGITGVAVGLALLLGFWFVRSSNGASEPTTIQSTMPVAAAGVGEVFDNDDITASRNNAIVRATQSVAPAVVSVIAIQQQEVAVRNPFRSRFFEMYFPQQRQLRRVPSYGSGVIIQKDGYVLTNEHVVSNAEQVFVSMGTGERFTCTVVGTAPSYDLALLKINTDSKRSFPAATMGDSDNVFVGEWVIAIGSPFGDLLADDQPTVTVGVVSALHRDIKRDENSNVRFYDMVQTDAAINPGNSGGPLINARGEVIGVNTFIISTNNGGSLGMGFAIPINRGKWVLNELIEHGKVRLAWIGMNAADIPPQEAVRLGLGNQNAVLVRQLYDGGPADRVGIKAGDQILAVEGVPIRSIEHFNRIAYGSRVGDRLKLRVRNQKGKERDVTVTLEERPDRT